jgi:hypothetical protein
MRTSWELMIDTLVMPPTGAAETDDDDTKWLRQRQRADTNTESETITGDQGSDDNDDIGTSDDGWEAGDTDTTGGGGLLRSPFGRARRVGPRLHRSNQDDKSSKRSDLDNSDGDATEPGSDSEQQQHGSRAGHSRDGTRVRRRHSSCDHGQRVSEVFEDAEDPSSTRRHKRKTNPLSASSERELTRKVVKKSKARSSRDEYDYGGHLLPVEALRKKWAKGMSPRSHHITRHRRFAVIDVCVRTVSAAASASSDHRGGGGLAASQGEGAGVGTAGHRSQEDPHVLRPQKELRPVPYPHSSNYCG